MKRKWSILLIFAMLFLSLSGCSVSKKSDIKIEEQSLHQITEELIGYFSVMDEASFQEFENGSDLAVNLSLLQNRIPADKAVFVKMGAAWQAAVKECGDYEGHETYEIEALNQEIVVRSKATFTERTAQMQFSFDEKGTLNSLTIDADYTKAEVMKTAAMNTLLGMGTVFAVLIFIAFVISLFAYIPKIQEKFYNRKKKDQNVAVTSECEESKELIDDTELVAVIAVAIAAHTGKSTDDFIVRRINRKKANKWN